MLSVAKFNAGSGAAIEKYMTGEIDANHREDYYSVEQKGQWHGELADELGFKGEVQPGELARILDGYHPQTAEPLASNAGEQHAPGWDCTFSAPKSVSMEWAFNPSMREAIEQAHNEAVREALDHLSEHAITNRDRHGEHAGQPVGGTIVATFQHGASREGDPQLHTHCAIANICKREDGTFAATDLDLRWKMAAGAVYRAELAAEMQKMGYAVERDGTSFRLAAADKKLEEEFSKRAIAITRMSREKGGETYAQQRQTTRDSRKDKDQTPEQLRASWDAAAREINYQPLPRAPEAVERGAMPLPEEMISRVCAQQSTCTEMQLTAAVMVEAQGKLTQEEAREYLAEVKRSAETVELIADKANGRGTNTTEARFTSREMFALEKGIGDRAVSMAADRTSIGAQAISEKSLEAAMQAKSLSAEQQAALKHITAEGRCAVVQGTAGAGKSYMLDAARDAFERDGREVIGCALSGKAAEGLQTSAGIPSDTIHGTLNRLEKGEIALTEKTVIIMDEAGMTGSRLMADLQKQCDDAGAKFILVQDTRQLQPVDAGGGGREVQNKIGACEMNEIRRQKDPAEQQMVHDFKDGHADRALNYLESQDRLKSYDSVSDARQAAAKAVVSDLSEGKTSISMADTRAACREMNDAAREQMRSREMLKGDDKSFKCEDRDGNTSIKQFAEGDRVIFLDNATVAGVEVKNGTTGTVTKASDGKLTVKLDGDKPRAVKVDQNKYQKIDHGYAFTVHKSQGVTVDRAHYAPGQMADRELGYVAGSRHRETLTLHSEKGRLNELREDLSKSHAKGTSQDYARKGEERDPAPKASDKLENAAKIEGLKAEAKDIEREMREASKSGQSDMAAELSEKLNDKNMEISRATPVREDGKQPPEPKEPAVRLAPRHEDVKRDGELARKALESHKAGRQAPDDGKQRDAQIKAGKLTEIRDSKGEKYYQDKKGNITADRLRDGRLQVTELKDGTRKTLLVDNRIGRVTLAGKEVFKGIKVGSKVIESKGREADGARKMRDMLGTRAKDAGALKKAADRLLTKHEKWKDAGLIRSTTARFEMSSRTMANEREAIKALQTKSAAGKQIEQKEKAATDKIRDTVRARETATPARPALSPALVQMRQAQQLTAQLSKPPMPVKSPVAAIQIRPPIPMPSISKVLER